MTRLLVYVLCLISGFVHGQRVSLSDSLYQVTRGEKTAVLKLDTRNSFITGRSAQVWGVKAGVSFQKRLSIGWHVSWLHTRIEQPLPDEPGNPVARVRMVTTGPFAEYVFYRKGPWEATIPVQLSWGKSHLSWEQQRATVRTAAGNVLMYEPTMVVEYRVLNLFAFGAGVGYRLMLVNNREIDQRFTSPVYMLRLRVLTDELIRRLNLQETE
jgi:hypothetical protein